MKSNNFLSISLRPDKFMSIANVLLAIKFYLDSSNDNLKKACGGGYPTLTRVRAHKHTRNRAWQ